MGFFLLESGQASRHRQKFTGFIIKQKKQGGIFFCIVIADLPHDKGLPGFRFIDVHHGFHPHFIVSADIYGIQIHIHLVYRFNVRISDPVLRFIVTLLFQKNSTFLNRGKNIHLNQTFHQRGNILIILGYFLQLSCGNGADLVCRIVIFSPFQINTGNRIIVTVGNVNLLIHVHAAFTSRHNTAVISSQIGRHNFFLLHFPCQLYFLYAGNKNRHKKTGNNQLQNGKPENCRLQFIHKPLLLPKSEEPGFPLHLEPQIP